MQQIYKWFINLLDPLLMIVSRHTQPVKHLEGQGAQGVKPEGPPGQVKKIDNSSGINQEKSHFLRLKCVKCNLSC